MVKELQDPRFNKLVVNLDAIKPQLIDAIDSGNLSHVVELVQSLGKYEQEKLKGVMLDALKGKLE